MVIPQWLMVVRHRRHFEAVQMKYSLRPCELVEGNPDGPSPGATEFRDFYGLNCFVELIGPAFQGNFGLPRLLCESAAISFF